MTSLPFTLLLLPPVPMIKLSIGLMLSLLYVGITTKDIQYSANYCNYHSRGYVMILLPLIIDHNNTTVESISIKH